MLRSLYLRLRTDGLETTLRLIGKRLFGDDRRLVFVRHHDAPCSRPDLPIKISGITVRHLQPSDLQDLQVRKHQPKTGHDITHAFVATQDDRIVGAAWYSDTIDERYPWYRELRSRIVEPSRLTENYYVLPGVKGAAMQLTKVASEQLAWEGVRTIVGIIGADNKPSILMSRLLGGKHAATIDIRYRLGKGLVTVDAVTQDSAVFGKSRSRHSG